MAGHVRFLFAINLSRWLVESQRLIAVEVRNKAESAGRVLVKVNPRGTSQTWVCGTAVPKTLTEGWHECPACGWSAGS